jgi:hypothetical protein
MVPVDNGVPGVEKTKDAWEAKAGATNGAVAYSYSVTAR